MSVFKSKRVGVLKGGMSPEREVSLETGKNCSDALKTLGYTVVDIDVGRDVAMRLVDERIDVAFIALHGRYGEDGCLQGLLETLAIPYTGSNVLASAAAMNKVFTKWICTQVGLKTAPFEIVADVKNPKPPAFGFPCVVKPSGEGSSVGVSICKKPEDFPAAVSEAAKFAGVTIAEQFIKGREINVAVLDGQVLGTVEIRFKGEFYDYHAKYVATDTEYVVPAPVTPAEERALHDAAARAYQALGCSGSTRIDLILDAHGSANLLEINTLPGMTSHSLVPKIAKFRGIAFEDLVERILDGAKVHA